MKSLWISSTLHNIYCIYISGIYIHNIIISFLDHHDTIHNGHNSHPWDVPIFFCHRARPQESSWSVRVPRWRAWRRRPPIDPGSIDWNGLDPGEKLQLPSGKQTYLAGKSPSLEKKIHRLKWRMFHCWTRYVRLPERNFVGNPKQRYFWHSSLCQECSS